MSQDDRRESPVVARNADQASEGGAPATAAEESPAAAVHCRVTEPCAGTSEVQRMVTAVPSTCTSAPAAVTDTLASPERSTAPDAVASTDTGCSLPRSPTRTRCIGEKSPFIVTATSGRMGSGRPFRTVIRSVSRPASTVRVRSRRTRGAGGGVVLVACQRGEDGARRIRRGGGDVQGGQPVDGQFDAVQEADIRVGEAVDAGPVHGSVGARPRLAGRGQQHDAVMERGLMRVGRVRHGGSSLRW